MKKLLGVILIIIAGFTIICIMISLFTIFFGTDRNSTELRKEMVNPMMLFGYIIFIVLSILVLRKGIKIYKATKIDRVKTNRPSQNDNSFEMIIHSKIELNDFIKLNYLLTYTKYPLLLLVNISGVFILINSILYYLGYSFSTGSVSPNIALVIGIFLSSMPILVYRQAKKHFRSNARLHEGIEYKFTNDEIHIKGESFKTEMTWEGTYKVEELSNWFLLYQNNVVFNPISKKNISTEQLDKFKNLVKSIPVIKTNIK